MITLNPPIVLCHLSGGLTMLVGENRSAILLSPGEAGPIMFSVLDRSWTLSLLQNQKPLRILGITYFSHTEEMNEAIMPNFQISSIDSKKRYFTESQFQLWSGIGTALSRTHRNGEAILANRVRQQIHVCSSRLERLLAAYRSTTVRASALNSIKHGFTSDAYAHYLGTEYRALINELYSLRDALLAATFRLLFKRADPFSVNKVKALVGEDSGKTSKLISNSMFEGGDLLIDRMSLYRSIALHCLGATNPLIGDIYQFRESEGVYGKLQYLVYPLYDDIERMRRIERGSSKGLFETAEESELRRFLELPSHQDALEFCFDCLNRLLRISEALAADAGISPEIVEIKEDEILELKIMENGVVTRHYERDSATGKLQEK